MIYPKNYDNSNAKIDIATSKGQCRALVSDTTNGYIYSTYEVTTTNTSNTSTMIKLNTNIGNVNNGNTEKNLIEIIDDVNDDLISNTINDNGIVGNANKSGAFPHILTGLHDVILVYSYILLILMLILGPSC